MTYSQIHPKAETPLVTWDAVTHPCGVQSPNGVVACLLEHGHPGDHEHTIKMAYTWPKQLDDVDKFGIPTDRKQRYFNSMGGSISTGGLQQGQG